MQCHQRSPCRAELIPQRLQRIHNVWHHLSPFAQFLTTEDISRSTYLMVSVLKDVLSTQLDMLKINFSDVLTCPGVVIIINGYCRFLCDLGVREGIPF
ncbi:hypothetical protein CEXT_166761 [Caerostris extrusa]|uniref:Uncharacterized protein n=1 Tax=Caerostris extrusa TaxID=172846 RepID=A0AAV4N0A2_CAEEX|nr:hypothetical protein CEXT_166761 [Caerostris extrusa]